jgi:hypothetical protein
LVQDRGGAEFKTAGILLYVEDLKRGSNKDIGPKDIFEMGSKPIPQTTLAKDRVVVSHTGSVGVSGLGFLAARGGRFFLLCGRFLGADFSGFGVVLLLVDSEDSGPKPKNAPGNERVLVFFDDGRAPLR